ncbi:MAG: MFS transporter [Hyphomicrobiales bacterium]|nr:MFS transporter [Hyphomicrobiales bacterium]
MKNQHTSTRNLNYVDAFTMFIVSALSVCLLLYVAFGEARRTNEQFQIDKLTGQAELMQVTLETFLHAGLPIRQYAGFSIISDPIMSTDKSIAGMAVRDPAGVKIFSVGDGARAIPSLRNVAASDQPEVQRSDAIIEISVPLRNKFERVGTLAVSMRRALIDSKVVEAFKPLLGVGFFACLMFALYTLFHRSKAHQSTYRRLTFVYAGVYLSVAAAVIWSMIAVYSNGAQAKAQSVAAVLGARLDDVPQIGLNYDQFTGISQLLEDYRRLNPDVSNVELTANGKIIGHVNKALVGKQYVPDSNSRIISLKLSPKKYPSDIELVVEIPKSVIYWQIARNAKNFAALFIASGLVASLFMELGRALRESGKRQRNHTGNEEEVSAAATLLVKPAYFLAVFVESLSYPILPHFAQQLATSMGVSASYASAPFMIYYAMFGLALIIALPLEKRFGPRTLMIAGLALCGASYFALSFDADFLTLVASRAMAGIGQGIMFIGVQSFALNQSRSNQRTQAAGIIVFGFQAGTLAGMAIGSLLVNYLEIPGLFSLATATSLLTCLYIFGIVPDLRASKVEAYQRRTKGGWSEFVSILRDSQFLRSMALIGVPAKAVMTGVVLFAMPLLLRQSGYMQEDVGQMTMIYAASVVIISHVVSRYVDRTGSVEGILLMGALLSGAGLLLISYAGQDVAAREIHANIHTSFAIGTSLMVLGVAMLGVAHGLINAPIVTNVANAPIATDLGAARVAAAYRLLERVGHITGPLILSQIFLMSTQSWFSLNWVAAATILFGLIFIATSKQSSEPGYPAELSQ